MKMFFALTAALGMVTISADATNGYANSPPPGVPTYVWVDDPYIDWYYEKHGVKLTKDMVLPVQHALQGHPESGALWEGHVNKILDDFDFKNTTHEKSTYRADIEGEVVLLCRQVDDLAVACKQPEIANKIIGLMFAESRHEE